MSLVYSGVLSHAPGITGRADLCENTELRDAFYARLDQQRQDIEDSGAEALIVIAAEHFANFFMNNMPAFCIGIGASYEGPIEDPEWLRIAKTKVPGAPDLGTRVTREVMNTIDVAYAEEWKFDHGIMVPLNFLTPNYDLPVIPVNINCQGPHLRRCTGRGHSARHCAGPVIRSRKRLPWSAQAVYRTGRRRRTPERSTKTGTGNSLIASCVRTRRHC